MNYKLFAILLLSIVVVSGCSHEQNQQEFHPTISFELDKSSVTVSDDSILEEFITATITRRDVENIETVFVIKPQNKENVYMVDVDGKKILELTTTALKGKDSKNIQQFKIYGKKGEAKSAEYELTLDLFFNNTKLEGQTKMIAVRIV